MKRVTRSLCRLALPLLAAAASAQEPPLPKPGPEHALLKQDEGVWDASVEMFMAPGAPPMVSKGVETNTMGQGGLFLVTDFRGDMMGTPFHGHGVSTWDVAKKKYTGIWTDSMSTGISTVESTYDAGAKKMTGMMEGPDMTGKVSKMKETTEWKDADTRVFTMYAPATPDGKEVPAMRITYKRKK